MKVFLLLIGAFYVFAGVVAARQALMSGFIDRAIGSISGARLVLQETLQSLWLVAGAFLILCGGVALLILADVALWLFVASAVGQAIYLFVVAPNYFDPASPPDPNGRRQTMNAFVIYLVATALVMFGASLGALRPWQEIAQPLLAAAIAAAAGFGGYLIWQLARFRA